MVETVLDTDREYPGWAARAAEREQRYGGDWEREIQEIEAGRHPLLKNR